MFYGSALSAGIGRPQCCGIRNVREQSGLANLGLKQWAVFGCKRLEYTAVNYMMSTFLISRLLLAIFYDDDKIREEMGRA